MTRTDQPILLCSDVTPWEIALLRSKCPGLPRLHVMGTVCSSCLPQKDPITGEDRPPVRDAGLQDMSYNGSLMLFTCACQPCARCSINLT